MDVNGLAASIARNPFDPAAIAGAWIVLLILGLVLRRYLRRKASLEAAMWWYILAGIVQSSLVMLRNLDARGDVAKQMETPVVSILLGTLSYAIVSLLWPLLWLFITTWLSLVLTIHDRIIREFAISQAAAIMLAPILTLLLRRWEHRSAARGEST